MLMISYKCSYFLAFNEYEKLFFKNIIDGRILISGSVKSNIEVKKKRNKKYDILFVSEYRIF